MGSAYKPYWIKLWVEILEDPKVQTMPDRLWRRMAELFLLAGKHNQDGELPPITEMAWVLRLDPGELEKDLKQLSKIGGKGREIVIKKRGKWILKNYGKRQSAAPAKTRMQKFRERKKDGEITGTLRGSYDNVTENSQEEKEKDLPTPDPLKKGGSYDNVTCILPETETETETEAETEAETDTPPPGKRIVVGYVFDPNQNNIVKEFLNIYGKKTVGECFMWAESKGMTAGEAIIAAKKALPHWQSELPDKLVTDEQRLRHFTKRAKEQREAKLKNAKL